MKIAQILMSIVGGWGVYVAVACSGGAAWDSPYPHGDTGPRPDSGVAETVVDTVVDTLFPDSPVPEAEAAPTPNNGLEGSHSGSRLRFQQRVIVGADGSRLLTESWLEDTDPRANYKCAFKEGLDGVVRCYPEVIYPIVGYYEATCTGGIAQYPLDALDGKLAFVVDAQGRPGPKMHKIVNRIQVGTTIYRLNAEGRCEDTNQHTDSGRYTYLATGPNGVEAVAVQVTTETVQGK